MLKTTETLLQEMKERNFSSNKKCVNCVFYVPNYKDDYTLRQFGYGEVKYRPACSWNNTYGFVEHNPAAICSYYEETDNGNEL